MPPRIHHVILDCGCAYEALHDSGDRAFICNCNRKWVVHAERPSVVNYSIKEIPNDPI